MYRGHVFHYLEQHWHTEGLFFIDKSATRLFVQQLVEADNPMKPFKFRVIDSFENYEGNSHVTYEFPPHMTSDVEAIPRHNAFFDRLISTMVFFTMKREWHFDELFVTNCTGNCKFDNVCCSQWHQLNSFSTVHSRYIAVTFLQITHGRQLWLSFISSKSSNLLHTELYCTAIYRESIARRLFLTLTIYTVPTASLQKHHTVV